jgi:hypothetical protein
MPPLIKVDNLPYDLCVSYVNKNTLLIIKKYPQFNKLGSAVAERYGE